MAFSMIDSGGPMKKIHFVLILCLAALTSCGAEKVAVKYADNYIEGQVEKRLPLYDQQEEVLSKDIDKFLNEHKDEVRKIMPIIDKVSLEDPASLNEQYPKFTAAYLEIAQDFSKILAKHMSVFEPKQTKEFLKKMREENNEIFLKDSDQRKEKIEERVTKILGSITKEQKKILKDNAKIFDAQVVTRSERRSKLHSTFKDILEQEISSGPKEKLIFDAFVANQKEALSDTKNLEIAKSFIPTLQPEQKKSLRTRMAELEIIINYFLETAY